MVEGMPPGPTASELAVAGVPGGSAFSTRALELGCAALSLVALVALSWRHMDLLGDSFWSIATGRWILEHGRLPETDPFSFTAEREWLVHMPLSQIVFAWVEQAVGVLGLELFGALTFTGALVCLWWGHARNAPSRLLTWPLLLLLVAVQCNDLCVRGQLFGDLFVALLLGCLFRMRDGRAVHPLLPLGMGSVWINLHASAFLSVALPLAFGLAIQLAEPRWLSAAGGARRSSALARALRPWLTFAGLAALGLLANPYGVHLVGDLIGLMRAASTAEIDLFGPPDFSSPGTLLTIAVVLAVLVLSVRRRSARVGLPEALVLGALLVAACAARRHQPLALAFAIAVVARDLSQRVPHLLQDPAARRWATIATAAVATATSIYGLSTDKDPWRDVPFDEARLIEDAGLPDHVANIYHWGGFLDYAWAGRRKVFIDGRNQLFERTFADSRRLNRVEEWAEVLDRYRINTVLWERGSALDYALSQSPDWAMLQRGRIAVVYVRRQALPALLSSLPRP